MNFLNFAMQQRAAGLAKVPTKIESRPALIQYRCVWLIANCCFELVIVSGGGSKAFSPALQMRGVPKNSVFLLGYKTGVEGYC